MKNLADFKKRLTIGSKWSAKHHHTFAGRDEKNAPIYNTKDLGVREVSIVQTNAVAFKTTRTDGEVVDSWLQFPKAKECKFTDNSIEIYEDNTLILSYTEVKEN